jgi:hypothetical protein
MAMTYQNFASLGVNLNRQKNGPLDISNVFTSAADLKYYLTEGAFTTGVSEYWYKDKDNKIVPYPYEGQVLATVIDGVVNVYTLALDAEGNFTTQEIAGKIEVDGTTIVKDAEGKLSIVAPVEPDSSKTYNFAYANGAYSWVEVDTATAAGQAQAIAGLTDRTVALETTVNGKPAVGTEGEEGYQPAVVGLTDKVSSLASEIVDEASAREEADQAILDKIGTVADDKTVVELISDALAEAKQYADDNDTDTVYDDTDVKARIKAIEDDYLKEEDKYDDTDLANRVKAIEDDYLKLEDKYDDTALANRVKALEDEERYDETPLANRVTTLETTSSDHETRIGKVEEFFKTADGESLAEAMDTLIEIQKEIAADNEGAAAMLSSIEANTTAITTLNGDATTAGSVDKKIADAIAPLATTEALNGVKATAEAAAVKSDVETELAKKVDKESYETDKATFAVKSDVEGALALKADADKVVSNDTFEQFKTDNEQAISDARTGAVADVEAKGYAVETSVAETYATKDELTEAVEGIENDLLAYAKTADVNTELAKKADSTAVYTKDEVDSKIGTPGVPAVIDEEGVEITPAVQGTGVFANAYSRAEVDKLLDEVQGGSSASADSVARQLNTYKSTNDERVSAIETKNGEQDSAIAKAQEDATKGINDAAKVAGDLATANLTIADNTREIGVAKSSIETVNTTLTEKITNLENADTTIKSDITSIQGIVSGDGGHASRINALEGRAAALEAKDTDLASLIQGNTDKFDNYTTTEGLTALLADKADKSDTYTKGEVNDLLANLDQSEIIADIETNANAIATLVGEDTGKSVRAIAGEEISALIKAADPTGNDIVIENIASLVKYVDENAGDIAALTADVDANKGKLAGIDTTVVAYVTDAISAIVMPKASEEVTLAEDGTLGIGKVNVNKLVQTEGDTLVLNGGNA